MKYFILAGEASGDKQAALLCGALRRCDPAAVMTGWGGEAMSAQGVGVTRHYRELAFMGFVEVVKHLPAIFRNFRKCKEEILHFRPDALILVDYPGFNLRMAKWAYKKGIPVYYYISPQLWAWHTSRVHTIKKAVRRMYVILPFEKDFYRQYGMEVMYIGHPLAQEMATRQLSSYFPKEKHIALLPGSRKHEIDRILPEMVRLTESMPDFTFYIAAVPHIPPAQYTAWISGKRNIHLETEGIEAALRHAAAAVVTSGTATLETALYGVPQVVVYKGNPISYYLAKRLVRVKYISLVNLIAGKPVVPELIQTDCYAVRIYEELQDILQPSRSSAMRAAYAEMKTLLTAGGGAMAAAQDMVMQLTMDH